MHTLLWKHTDCLLIGCIETWSLKNLPRLENSHQPSQGAGGANQSSLGPRGCHCKRTSGGQQNYQLLKGSLFSELGHQARLASNSPDGRRYWAGLLCSVSSVMWHLMLWSYFLTQLKKKYPALNPHLFLSTSPPPLPIP